MSRDRYLDPYRASASRHGPSFEATLWANERAQQLRFRVFADMCDLTAKRILDAGCSRGDFAAYLLDRNVAFESYTGVDALDEVIEFAAARNLARCRFLAGDFLTDPSLLELDNPQVICISGSLNTMTDRQVRTVLDAAWQAAGETLLFNFLPNLATRRAPAQFGPARRLDALALIKWATTQTGAVHYRQDYFNQGHDATIMMQKR